MKKYEFIRGSIFWINLDPTIGKEIQKQRPCIIISPDELNNNLSTYIIAPLTTGKHPYPFRVPYNIGNKNGHIIIDQIRVVDANRFGDYIGQVDNKTLEKFLSILQEMFAY